jgi:hypothetical protein
MKDISSSGIFTNRIKRKIVKSIGTRALTTLAVLLIPHVLPLPAMATQGHGGIEGVYAHQMAHLFFIFSMGVLIYWLRDRKLTIIPGWRYIQYSALFFILWNVDAYVVHYLEEQLDLLEISRRETWLIEIRAPEGFGWLGVLYYFAKLDHLLCVPALFCMYQGLKRLLHESGAEFGKGRR